jgi:hypothetical protein
MKFREFFRVSRDIFQSITFSSNSSLQLTVYTQEMTNTKTTALDNKHQLLPLVTRLLRVAQKSDTAAATRSGTCVALLRDTHARDV